MSALASPVRPRARALAAASLPALLALAALELHGLDALRAAGIAGTAPGQGAGAFKSLLNTLQQNAEWMIATGLGLGFTIVGLMYFVGSMRAPDYLLKIGACIAIILVVGPAVVA
jgi:hypothetical protein